MMVKPAESGGVEAPARLDAPAPDADDDADAVDALTGVGHDLPPGGEPRPRVPVLAAAVATGHAAARPRLARPRARRSPRTMTSPRRCYCCSASSVARTTAAPRTRRRRRRRRRRPGGVRGKCRRGASAETAAFPRPTAVSDVETRERLWVSATRLPGCRTFVATTRTRAVWTAAAPASRVRSGSGSKPRARRG